MNDRAADEINALRLTLHGRLVGYLAGCHNGRKVLSFAEEFKSEAARLKSGDLSDKWECPNDADVTANPNRQGAVDGAAGSTPSHCDQ
jgi:serine/threonine-protein kinase HipA